MSDLQENQPASNRPAHRTDIVIVGAGPIGIELAILLKKAGIDYKQFDGRQIGDTISKWPPNTRFFSSPERVALAGVPLHTFHQQSVTGETYLAYLRELVETFDLEINTFERVIDIEKRVDGHFLITTRSLSEAKMYRAKHVVMAIGNMNAPKTLGLPGEHLPHVFHALPDPHLFFRQKLLIIGGKNSALEAALRCWRSGAQVALSYRRGRFETSIVKPHLSREIKLLIDKNRLTFYPNTTPKSIEAGWASLAHNDNHNKTTRIPADFVLFCIGYESDVTLYQKAGVNLIGDAQKPEFDPQTMETNVENLYVCGTTAGGMETTHELFISTCHDHVKKVMKAITGLDPSVVGPVRSRSYEVSFEDVQED